MNDVLIENWSNENGHKTARENTFRNNQVYSIVMNRRERLDILKIEPFSSIPNLRGSYITKKENLGWSL